MVHDPRMNTFLCRRSRSVYRLPEGGDRARPDNIRIFGGLGYILRQPGRFTSGFDFSIHAGGMTVTTVDPLSYDSDGTPAIQRAPGESEWIFASFFSLLLLAEYNITPVFSIKWRTFRNSRHRHLIDFLTVRAYQL
jgi:hypothetical protein